MIGDKQPRQGRGQPIRAKLINTIARAGENLARLHTYAGIPQSHFDGQPIVGGMPETGLIPVKSHATGIASHTFKDCEYYKWNGSALVLSGVPISVYNPYGTAVGANKFCWVTLYMGVYMIVTEAC